MSETESERLVQQAMIVATMMLAVSRAMHADYRHKHVGAVWEGLLTAFVLWHVDTVAAPKTILGIAKFLGIPRSNVKRACEELVAAGLACKIKRRYARDVRFILARPGSPFFVDIRVAVMTAGRELERVFGSDHIGH